MQLTIDHEKAAAVVRSVYEAFSGREGLLADISDLIEFQIPVGVEPLSREHALFLFYLVPNDHGTKSRLLYQRARNLHAERPDLFDPESILRKYEGPADAKLLEEAVQRIGSRYPRVAAKNWYLNSERLICEYGGDARRLFASSSEAGKLLETLTSFRGFGPKTGGMLLRAIVGLRFAQVENLEEVLLPVDIHDTRISFWTGIVGHTGPEVSGDNYYQYVREVQRILRDTCRRLGIDWTDVDRALWLIGSRGCVKKDCQECPIKELCTVGRATLLSFVQQGLSFAADD